MMGISGHGRIGTGQRPKTVSRRDEWLGGEGTVSERGKREEAHQGRELTSSCSISNPFVLLPPFSVHLRLLRSVYPMRYFQLSPERNPKLWPHLDWCVPGLAASSRMMASATRMLPKSRLLRLHNTLQLFFLRCNHHHHSRPPSSL